MKKLVIVVIMALIGTGSVCAQRVKRYETEALDRAEKLMNEGKLKESLTYFDAELKEHPKNPYAYFLMSTVYMKMGRYDYAMPAIDKAIKYMPRRHKELRGMAYALKATIHEAFQEWEEAVKQLTLCLSVMPKYEIKHRVVAHKQRAEIYEKLEQYELAEQDFKKSEELKLLLKGK